MSVSITIYMLHIAALLLAFAACLIYISEVRR